MNNNVIIKNKLAFFTASESKNVRKIKNRFLDGCLVVLLINYLDCFNKIILQDTEAKNSTVVEFLSQVE